MTELFDQFQEGNVRQDLPYHRHTGLDSPQVDYNDLLNKPAGTPAIYGRMYRNEAQTVSNTTDTKIAFDASNFVLGITADASNNRFTALTAGYYKVDGSITYDSPVTGKILSVTLRVNNTEMSYFYKSTATTDACTIGISDIVSLGVGDYVELFSFHNCGGDEAIQGGSLYTYLTIHKI